MMKRVLRNGLMLAATALFAVVLHQRVMDASDAAEARGHAPALPQRLSETGLYSDASTLTIADRNRPFAPQYPLWSDGAQKRRWVQFPDGASIDARAVERWTFPDGTTFWKEFSFGGRRVETRLLRKVHGDWQFASYRWNDAQTDAERVPDNGVTTDIEVAPGKRHRIPGTMDCRACHDSARTEILGFNALQLSDDRDPNAPHGEALTPDMITLRTLLQEHRLDGDPHRWRTTPPRIEAPDAQTRAVLGYLATNCGSCHNRESSIANVGLDLKGSSAQGCAVGLATTVERPSAWAIPSAPTDSTRRIQPGRPDLSSVVARMRSRGPSSQMPPIGTAVADAAGLALLTSWVEADAATWAHRLATCR